jgi:ribosomal protein L37E
VHDLQCRESGENQYEADEKAQAECSFPHQAAFALDEISE